MHLRHHEDHVKFNKTLLKKYFLFFCNNNLEEQVLVNLGVVGKVLRKTKVNHCSCGCCSQGSNILRQQFNTIIKIPTVIFFSLVFVRQGIWRM